MDYKRDRMIDELEDFVARSTLSHCADEMFMKGWEKACEAVQPDIDKLRQALRAAEAECAEWRDKAGFPPCPVNKIGWGTDSERNWEALIPAADANDATRARLGLGKIGEAR